VLDALAVVALQVLDDLALLAPVLVDRDADAPAGRGQRAAEEAGELALDVEEADLLEVEDAAVEVEPLVHVAPVDVVGQVVEVVEADAGRLRVRRVQPVEFGVIGRCPCGRRRVGEIDQAAADADDRRHVQHLVRRHRAVAPFATACSKACAASTTRQRHRRRAGAVLLDEARAWLPGSSFST
jgi:hypothetical protein